MSAVFRERPYAFFIGGVSLIVSFQFISLGFLSLQNKRYFEELFHLNSGILKNVIEQNDITDKLNTSM